ncbi:hypothetical protein TRL7639_02658 [Falsiruegeria litorea R37]|uniref:Uncharacterized protein n=1 Tax=Falsiruegeria litorea R37 TaxID=1200284 RepID=A0A1Y5SUP8_9RHOB|nr:hypothetical protein TRL7639_02658 [Falsiruegeria litorea R37]
MRSALRATGAGFTTPRLRFAEPRRAKGEAPGPTEQGPVRACSEGGSAPGPCPNVQLSGLPHQSAGFDR